MQKEIIISGLLPEKFPEQPPEKPKKVHYLHGFVCVICAVVSLSIITLCIAEKIKEISVAGVQSYVEKALLGEKDSLALGNKICDIAFGGLPEDKEIQKVFAEALSLPKVYYVPKEEIIDKVYLNEEKLEKLIFDLYSFDLSKVPKGSYPIIPTDFSAKNPKEIKNDTSYNISMDEISKAALMLTPAEIQKEPLVLILHTHGTESFSDNTCGYYNDEINNPRSHNLKENVVAVGQVLAEALNKKGIPTLHCETMHDKDSYIEAYDRSAESIRFYLEKYPSIKYVFDVHRDSLIRSDLTKLKPVTLRGDKAAAQIMIIIGSDEKGAGEYNWEKNLILATAIQKELIKDTEGIARQLYLRGASYNQQYAEHGLLLEIGSCGNTLAEAKEAALAFADAFEKTIK